MATVYSLVCWGGRTGKNVTLTIASPCVVSLTNHGARDGTGIVFSTTGALPTGITAGTTYYTRSTATGTFHLYDTAAHAKDTANTTGRINTSGTQSGTHTAKSALMASYFSQYAGRWGAAGSERCYDGIASWASGRAAALEIDTEVCELGEGFTETRSGDLVISIPAASFRIESKVNGVRTSAFHNGVIGAGFVFYQSSGGAYYAFGTTSLRATFEGFSVQVVSGFYGSVVLYSTTQPAVKNMMVIGPGGYTSIGGASTGIQITGGDILNSVVVGCATGIAPYAYGSQIIANNFVTKCGTGFGANGGSNTTGWYYNNISIGNTTNWGSASGFTKADKNAGLSGEAWMSTGKSRITVATTDFVNLTTGDFRPAALTSPQVECATDYYGALSNDIGGAERPNYTGSNYGTDIAAGSFVSGLSYIIKTVGDTDFTAIGASANTVGVVFKATGPGSGTGTATLGAVFDVGPYEFNHGYGNWPAMAAISLTNIVSGSRVLITRDDTSAALYNDVPGASLDFVTGYIGAFTVIIRKASSSPYYREFTAGGNTVANQSTTIKVIQQLDE